MINVFLFFKVGVQLLYHVVLVSAVQQHECFSFYSWNSQMISVREAKAIPRPDGIEWRNKYKDIKYLIWQHSKKKSCNIFFQHYVLKNRSTSHHLDEPVFFDRDNKKRASPDVRFYVIMKKFS